MCNSITKISNTIDYCLGVVSKYHQISYFLNTASVFFYIFKLQQMCQTFGVSINHLHDTAFNIQKLEVISALDKTIQKPIRFIRNPTFDTKTDASLTTIFNFFPIIVFLQKYF